MIINPPLWPNGAECAVEITFDMIETYRRFKIQQTFFVPAWCIEQYPDAVSRMIGGVTRSPTMGISMNIRMNRRKIMKSTGSPAASK